MDARLLLDEKNKDKVRASEVSRPVQACYRSEDSTVEQDEIELHEWLGFIPYENAVKDNLEYFVLKLYEILTKVEASQQKDPNKKGIRSFSLLPYSSTYSAAYIVINGSTLHGFCARIYKKTGGRNPLDIPLTASGKVLIFPAEVCKSKGLFLRRGFAVSQLETMAPNVAISKREFDEMSHETKSLFASRLFANPIATNGYSTSALLSRPRQTSKTSKKKLRTQQTKTKEAFDEEWHFLLNDYEVNALVAIDPGMRSLCTAVSEGMKTKKEEDNAWWSSFTPSRCRNGSFDQYEGIPARRGNEQGALLIRKPQETQKAVYQGDRRHPVIQDWQLRVVLETSESVLAWHFFQSRMKEKAMDAIARRIVPVVSPSVLVGYGDWSRRDGISGHAPSPVKGLQKALKKSYRGGRGRVQDKQTVLGLSLAARPSASTNEVERPGSGLEEDQKRFALYLRDCKSTF